MTELVLIIAALFPAILLWVYIWKQDAQREPTNWLIKAVLYGIAIAFPVSLLEFAINSTFFGTNGGPTSLLGTTFDAFFVAAIPEESFKLLALWLILRKNPFYDEHFDGIVYAVSIGLGFAAIENVLYLFDNIENWRFVAITRALLAVPGHYAFAVLMGYYYSLHHFVDHSRRAAILILFMPVLAHGIYDALALSGMVNPYVGSVCFIVLIYFCVKMHKFAQKKVIAHIQRDKEYRTSV